MVETALARIGRKGFAMELLDYEKDHLSRVREGLAECMVLLRTDGAFPLEKAGTLAAFGNGVRYSVKGGSGSGDDNLSRCAKEGICKVNIYTDLYLAAMKALDEEDTSSYFKVRDALQKGMNECLEHYFKVFGTRA